jgi:ADP-ribose pyrophosphatase
VLRWLPLLTHILRITYTDPEGVERTWESGERLTRHAGSDIDGVGVVAILKDPSKPDESPRIVLQKQWRPPVNAVVIEIPAGLMDPNELPETCALRELKEECGYVGEVMGGGFAVSPIMFNGTLLFFLMIMRVARHYRTLFPPALVDTIRLFFDLR